MRWRDTVMTQTELYDKLDEVTARLDAAAEIIANSFESNRPVDTAEAAIWLAVYEQAVETRVVEKCVKICCHYGCGKPSEPGKLFCAHHAYEMPAGFELPSE